MLGIGAGRGLTLAARSRGLCVRHILSGLEQLTAEHGVDSVHIVDLDSEEQLPAAFLAHSRVGEHLDPKSKIDAFAERNRRA